MTDRACFTVIPDAVYKALDNGDITAEQFDIFTYCYHRAERPANVVRSYSAAQVCRFRWLDATKANVKKYERAAADLLARRLIRRDYYRIDPKRSSKKGRTYSVWVPSPNRFQLVATPQENEASLWGANVGLLVGDIVGLQADETPSEPKEYKADETDNVGLLVGMKADHLSTTNQENQNPEKESPLPPEGVSPPPALVPREHLDATGLSESTPTPKPAGKKNALSPDQCKHLSDAAHLFSAFTNLLYDFVTDPKAAAALLREFPPNEILCAMLSKFSPDDKVVKTTMQYFFFRGAATLIRSARLNETCFPRRFSVNQICYRCDRSEAKDKWQRVLDAYEKVFGIKIENAFEQRAPAVKI
jgi:hypothetical protein